MSEIAPYLLSFILLYKYWALFGIIFLSALIVPFPSNSVLLASGAFASQGYMNLAVACLVAIVANVLGDCIDYMLARIYGRHLLQTFHVRIPQSVTRIESFMKRYPGTTIVITRFVGTIEELVSMLAGFAGIPFGVFLFYDIIGNVISDGGVLYVGYFLGVHWQDFTSLFSIFGWILLALACVAGIFIALMYRNHQRNNKNTIPLE